MRTVRWLLVVPASIAAWYAIFIVGLLIHGLVESAQCPAGEMVSGMCTDAHVQKVLEGLIVVFVGLSGLAVVAAAVATAPSHRAATAWFAFCVGSVVAAYFAAATKMYVSGAAAVLLAFITAFVIARRTPQTEKSLLSAGGLVA